MVRCRGTGKGGTKRKLATTETAEKIQKGNAKKKRTSSSKSGKAMKREEELSYDEEEDHDDEPSLDTADLEDILT